MHRNKGPYSAIIIASLFIAFFFHSATHTFAHKVNIFAWVENGTINTESYFPDGKVVQNGSISVFDSNENLLLTGKTDSEGMFSFPVPKGDDLTIILDASMGHRATFTITQEELGESTTSTSLKREQREDSASIGKVFVGIGCILGLMGLIMFIYSKRKK